MIPPVSHGDRRILTYACLVAPHGSILYSEIKHFHILSPVARLVQKYFINLFILNNSSFSSRKVLKCFRKKKYFTFISNFVSEIDVAR